MRIFLSYSRQDSKTAEEVQMALIAEGHSVFFDRTSLSSGEAFHSVIRSEIAAADFFVFLVSPSSIRFGGYAQTELKFVKSKWPNPSKRVLPVLVTPTPTDDIPTYLQAVTFLEPVGNVAAETAEAISRFLPTQVNPASYAPRVLTHIAVLENLPARPALFVNVTNLSSSASCELTHIWLETVPKAHILCKERPLPAHLSPLASWETWLFLDEFSAIDRLDDLFTLARVRLSTGDVLTSKQNEFVPERGFVPGAGE